MSESTETFPYVVLIVIIVVVVIIGLARYYGENIINFFKGLYQGGVSVFSSDKETKPGKSIWEVSFLVFEYKDSSIFSQNLYYSYSEEEWYWSFDKETWISSPSTAITISGKDAGEGNRDFIKSLEGKTYSEGLRLLIDRLLNEKGKLLSADKADMDNKGEFAFRYQKTKDFPETEIFNFRFFDNKWEWKPYRTEGWILGVKLEGSYYGEPVELIRILEVKDFYQGAEIIFSGEAGGIGEIEKTCEEDCGKEGSCTQEECEELSIEIEGKYGDRYCVFEQGITNKCRTYRKPN